MKKNRYNLNRRSCSFLVVSVFLCVAVLCSSCGIPNPIAFDSNEYSWKNSPIDNTLSGINFSTEFYGTNALKRLSEMVASGSTATPSIMLFYQISNNNNIVNLFASEFKKVYMPRGFYGVNLSLGGGYGFNPVVQVTDNSGQTPVLHSLYPLVRVTNSPYRTIPAPPDYLIFPQITTFDSQSMPEFADIKIYMKDKVSGATSLVLETTDKLGNTIVQELCRNNGDLFPTISSNIETTDPDMNETSASDFVYVHIYAAFNFTQDFPMTTFSNIFWSNLHRLGSIQLIGVSNSTT